MKLTRGTSTNTWNAFYACNGGGFSQLGSTLTGLFWSASPRVETFAFTTAASVAFFTDSHTGLNYVNSAGAWVGNFGTMHCVNQDAHLHGRANAAPATSWTTTTTATNCV